MNRNPEANKMPDILVVDDNPTNLELLKEMLKTNGYKVRPVCRHCKRPRACIPT